MLSKFKVNKTNNMYVDHFGNLKYCSIRGLKHMQPRFQDDFESLMYVVFKGVTGELPWDTDLNQISFDMERDEMIQVYKTLRITNYNSYLS